MLHSVYGEANESNLFFALEPSTRQFAFLFLLCVESVLFYLVSGCCCCCCGVASETQRLDMISTALIDSAKGVNFSSSFCAKSKNPFALYKRSLMIMRLSHSVRPARRTYDANVQCSEFSMFSIYFRASTKFTYNSISACLGRIHNSTQPKQPNSIHSYIEMHACSSFYIMLGFDFIHVGFVLLHSKVDLFNTQLTLHLALSRAWARNIIPR